eukprot:scaffold676_cov115-Isochrysis_galbana.AAC.21
MKKTRLDARGHPLPDTPVPAPPRSEPRGGAGLEASPRRPLFGEKRDLGPALRLLTNREDAML